MVAADIRARAKAALAEITDPTIELTDVDVNNCDREPIHIPAAIQPHGVMLVAHLSEPLAASPVAQVSQNVTDFFEIDAQQLLTQPISSLLPADTLSKIESCLQTNFEATNPLRLELETLQGLQAFSAVVYQQQQRLIVELEPAQPEKNVDFFEFYSSVKQPVSRLQQTTSLNQLCQQVVEEVQKITGFDRVMLYRLEPDGSGNVVAEVKPSEQSAYLGLHYPATDIPRQARYLYELNPVRTIPDVTYQPVPLVPQQEADRGPLDMSLSTLRSVSPVHLEYMRNMGVRASMSVSLLRNQKLWGLIACHHYQPKVVPYELRTICEFLAQVVSIELAAKEDSEDAGYQMRIKAIQTDFISSLTDSSSIKEGLVENSGRQLINLAGAAGVAYCERGEITTVGETPSEPDIIALLDWLGGQFGDDVIYQTDCLSDVYPDGHELRQHASGVLALSISQVQEITLLWFRPEVTQVVNWAGNPQKVRTVDEDGEVHLSPRQSFALWREAVQMQSTPWKTCEINAARELRSAIIGLVLRKADELAQVNLELTRSNVELDSFAYIASHDLKEPLRGIHNYSSFLIEDYSTELGDEGTSKLETLMRLTQRMEDLINSLLHYSRLGRADLRIRLVNLNELIDAVTEVIEMSKQEAVIFDAPRPLPDLACDRTQIIELFTNLVSNGIKYNSSDQKRIEIGYLTPAEASEKGLFPSYLDAPLSTTIFYVKDNGIGIREKHLDLIFRIFKRLHPPRKFGGGTGAGLTIAKKIVERHGGHLWIASVYGEGSTFYFTLEKSTHE